MSNGFLVRDLRFSVRTLSRKGRCAVLPKAAMVSYVVLRISYVVRGIRQRRINLLNPPSLKATADKSWAILGIQFSIQRLANRERKTKKDCVNVENGVKLGEQHRRGNVAGLADFRLVFGEN